MEIEIKTPEQLALMRKAGLVVAAALEAAREAVKPGVTTADLDAIAEDVIRSSGAMPSFKGYHGFPAHDLLLGQRAGRAHHPERHSRCCVRAT